ncbi:hypothetical protein GM658_26205 [Pseudoduganella eburnea]|uniref:Lipoprotein n=1 Tax=Massilia eburnea TaxID=1776165 RepID=A0A6L6QP10_9BURK|nr:hypothetical protein [Massilia eburnea]MTW14112.1 hypothetical protein [Massilia eburnea]
MRLLTTTALVLLVSACSNKEEKPAAAAAAPVPPSASKPSATRPAELPATLAVSTDCALERFNDAPPSADDNAVTDKSKVYLNGWAANSKSDQAPGDVYIEMTGPGHYFVKAERGIQRPDIAEVYKKPLLVNAGWSVTMDLSGVAPGAYDIKILEAAGAGSTECVPSNKISIPG